MIAVDDASAIALRDELWSRVLSWAAAGTPSSALLGRAAVHGVLHPDEESFLRACLARWPVVLVDVVILRGALPLRGRHGVVIHGLPTVPDYARMLRFCRADGLATSHAAVVGVEGHEVVVSRLHGRNVTPYDGDDEAGPFMAHVLVERTSR